MTEQILQSKIIKRLEKEGYYVVKVISATRRGVPDLLCCSPKGRFVAIELKHPNKACKPSALQEHNMTMVERRNGSTATLNSMEGLNTFLQTVEKTNA